MGDGTNQDEQWQRPIMMRGGSDGYLSFDDRWESARHQSCLGARKARGAAWLAVGVGWESRSWGVRIPEESEGEGESVDADARGDSGVDEMMRWKLDCRAEEGLPRELVGSSNNDQFLVPVCSSKNEVTARRESKMDAAVIVRTFSFTNY